jgi:SAM-dependent methyltransferase
VKKDYMPIEPEDSTVAEHTLVEKHWTNIWQQQRVEYTRRIAAVARREEYRIMRPYLARVRGGTLLDGGCGLGEWVLYFDGQGYKTYGVDISCRTIAALNQRFPTHHFLCSDIRQLQFPDQTFDIYFSWGVFEHFETGLGDCITEAYRVLRPGGYLFISVPFQNWRHILRDLRLANLTEMDQPSLKGNNATMRFYQWRLTRPELHRELVIRGFRVHKIYPIHKHQGTERWLRLDVPLFKPGSRQFSLAKRLFARLLPANFVSHMILAVAQKPS